MRRFAADARLDQLARAGRLDAALIDRLAAAVADFHARCEQAPERSAFGTPPEIRRWARDNFATLRELAHDAATLARIDRLARWTEEEFARRAEVFAQRRGAGFVRECHGDLHLGNLVLIEGRPLPFDCIEFNADLRFIDVANDIAFTWMDLLDHGLPRLAARLANGYLEATGDYAGLPAWRFYAVYRALVRAKVALIRRAQPDVTPAQHEAHTRECARYLAVAESIARTAPRRLLLTCGVSGSGKTTVAQHLLEHLSAVRVRSDVERKRLVGIAAAERRAAAVGRGLYDAATTERTYGRLAELAAAIVDAGFPAIVDATFLRAADRQRFHALADRLGAAFSIVLCEAPPAILRARVQARQAAGTDASDATLAVLDSQLQSLEQPAADEAAQVFRLSTDADPGTVAARCEALAARLATPGPSSRA
jgi:hypothetical protein